MENKKQLVLIEGLFSQDEARELLNNLFNSKINFHKVKNWSSNERFGKDDRIAQERIPLLRQEIEKLKEILADAKAQNKQLSVTSTIDISFIDQ